MEIDNQQRMDLDGQDQGEGLTPDQRAQLATVARGIQDQRKQLLAQAAIPGPDGACARSTLSGQREDQTRIDDDWARVFCPARKQRMP